MIRRLRRTVRTLAESLTADVVLAGRDPASTFTKMMRDRGAVSHAELSALIAVAQAASSIHRSAHWIARGQSFNSDHEMYGELYESLNEGIDVIAERAVGLGADACVDVVTLTESAAQVIRELCAPSTVPAPDALAERSLAAEFFLLRFADCVIKSMREIGTLSSGIDNMLQEFCDSRERALYKLRRRSAS